MSQKYHEIKNYAKKYSTEHDTITFSLTFYNHIWSHPHLPYPYMSISSWTSSLLLCEHPFKLNAVNYFKKAFYLRFLRRSWQHPWKYINRSMHIESLIVTLSKIITQKIFTCSKSTKELKSKVWNKFKVNNKDTRTRSSTSSWYFYY